MMYIIYGTDGSILDKNMNEIIVQGNDDVNKIFVAFTDRLPSLFVLTAHFTLPNGEHIVKYSDATSELLVNGTTYQGIELSLSKDVTALAGSLKMNIQALDSTNDTVLTSYVAYLTINEGVDPGAIAMMTEEEYNNFILQLQEKISKSAAILKSTSLLDPNNFATGQALYVCNYNHSTAILYQKEVNGLWHEIFDFNNFYEKLKRNQFVYVNITTYPTYADFLESEGQIGIIYLYPVNLSDLDEGYYQNIWTNNEWAYLGTTNINMAGYVTTDTEQNIPGTKHFDTISANRIDLPSDYQVFATSNNFKILHNYIAQNNDSVAATFKLESIYTVFSINSKGEIDSSTAGYGGFTTKLQLPVNTSETRKTLATTDEIEQIVDVVLESDLIPESVKTYVTAHPNATLRYDGKLYRPQSKSGSNLPAVYISIDDNNFQSLAIDWTELTLTASSVSLIKKGEWQSQELSADQKQINLGNWDNISGKTLQIIFFKLGSMIISATIYVHDTRRDNHAAIMDVTPNTIALLYQDNGNACIRIRYWTGDNYSSAEDHDSGTIYVRIVD